MLARTYKTPVQLGITQIEFDALLKTAHHMETGKIQPHLFSMFTTGDPDFQRGSQCKTPACICGWARHFCEDKNSFKYNSIGNINGWAAAPLGLRRLFHMGLLSNNEEMAALDASWHNRDPKLAARSIYNFLTFGDPCHEEVFGGLDISKKILK